LQLAPTGGFVPKPDDKLSIVTAVGGISGEFANVLNEILSKVVYGR
jgi:hypothetical protein